MNYKRISLFLAVILSLLSSLTLVVRPVQAGGPGDVDITFGNQGVVTYTVNPYSRKMLVQSDDKIVSFINGNAGLVRYLPDGALDTSFGTNGYVTLTLHMAIGMAVQSDGKILVTGAANTGSTGNCALTVPQYGPWGSYQPYACDFALQRYNANGSLDTTFGSGGTVTTDFASNPADTTNRPISSDIGAHIVIQSDGKIIVVGKAEYTEFGNGAWSGFSRNTVAVARYNSNGTLDTTYGTRSGRAMLPVYPTAPQAPASTCHQFSPFDIGLDGSGRLILAGSRYYPCSALYDMEVMRLTTAGLLDTTFDGDGMRTLTFATPPSSNSDPATGVVIQPDSKIVLSVNTMYRPPHIVRLNTDGSLDTTFNSTGYNDGGLTTWQNYQDIVRQPDGKFIIGGDALSGGSPTGTLFSRYNTDGSLDTTFGSGGHSSIPSISVQYVVWIQNIARQSSGKILATGNAGILRLNIQNIAPVAITDTATTDEDVAVAINVLANDFDPNQPDRLNVSSVATPLHGTTAISGVNTVVYTPTLDFSGVDTFTYVAHSSDGLNATGTVTVTVRDLTAPPNPTVTDSSGATGGVWQSTHPNPNFTWSPPFDWSGIAGYKYCFSDNAACTPATSITSSPLAVTVAPLTRTVYYLRMTTTDGAGLTSPAGTVFTFKYIDPNAAGNKPGGVNPDNVLEVNGDITQAWQNQYPDTSFTWTGPADPAANDGPAITGWNIKWQRGITDCLVSPTVLQAQYVAATNSPTNDGAYNPAAVVTSGDYCLLVQTVDEVGGLSDWVTGRHLRYDNILPDNPATTTDTAQSATSGIWGAWNDPAFQFSGAYDANAGIAGYYYCWDTDIACDPTTYTTGNTFDPPAVLLDGTYYLRVKAKDGAGNVAPVGTAFVYRSDINGPQNPDQATEIKGSPNGEWQGTVNSPAFTWPAANDSPGSGVAGYEVCFSTSSTCTVGTYTTSASWVPGPQAEGQYYLRVRPKDNAGNWGTWSTIFDWRYDSTIPSNPTVTEAHGYLDGVWQRAGGQYEFTWSGASDPGSDIAGYNVCWSDSAFSCTTAYITTTTTAYTPPVMDAGAKYLRIRAYNNAGLYANWQSPSYTARYDNLPPTNITNLIETQGPTPANTWQRTNSSPTFAWSGATDAHSGVGGYEYQWSEITSTLATTQTTVHYNALSTGVYTISVRSKDVAGNTATSWRDFTFKYDSIAPNMPAVVTETKGSQTGAWQNFVTLPVFNWTAPTDVGSGLNSYSMCWDSDGTCNCAPATVVTQTNYSPAQVTATGEYCLRMFTRDVAGNVSADQTVFSFLYDRNAPASVTSATETHDVASNSWHQNTQRSFTWTKPADVGSGTTGYDVYYGTDANGSTVQASVTTEAYDAPNQTSSTYYLRLRSRDAAGNASAWTTVYVARIDTQAPTNPAANSATDGYGSLANTWQRNRNSAQINLTASTDLLSGVKDYLYCWGVDPNCTPSVSLVGTTLPELATLDPTARPYYLKVVARDNALNQTIPYTAYTFLFDGELPTVVASATTTIAESGVWNSSAATELPFTWSAADDFLGSGVKGYYYYWGPASTGTSNDFTTQRALTVPAPAMTGEFYLRIRTIDNVGNLSAWNTAFIYRHDTQGPTNPTVSAPAFTEYSNFPVQWAASDPGSGVDAYQVQVKDGAGDWTDWLPNAETTGEMYPGEAGHTYQFRARGIDNAGNAGDWSTPTTTQVLGGDTQPTPEATTTPTATPLPTDTPTPTPPASNFATATAQAVNATATAQAANATATAQAATATAQAENPATPTPTATPIPAPGSAQLSAVKLAANSTTARPEDYIIYTVSVTNTGTVTAANVVIYAGEPDYTILSDTTGWIKIGNSIYWSGDIGPGQTWSQTYTAKVNLGTTIGTVISNMARVYYQFDRFSNQVDVVTLGQPILTQSTLGANTATTRRGETVRYTLTARNTGNAEADVQAAIQADTADTLGAASLGADWSGRIPPYGIQSIVKDVNVTNGWPGDVITTTGLVKATGASDYNLAPVPVTIIGPDLRLSLVTTNVPTAAVGSLVHYAVVLRNNSSSEGATGITVLVPPPALTTFKPGSLTAGWWDNVKQRVVWQGNLAPHGEFSIGFDVTAAISGTTATTATVTYNSYTVNPNSPDLIISANGGGGTGGGVYLPIILK